MTRRMLVIPVMVLAIGALLSATALAGNGPMKGKAAQQQVNKGNAGNCPFGNTPQGGKVLGKARGYGPGDGVGNGGDGPKDGTGYGKGKKGDGTAAGLGICDGTGPKEKMNKGPGKNSGMMKATSSASRSGRNR